MPGSVSRWLLLTLLLALARIVSAQNQPDMNPQSSSDAVAASTVAASGSPANLFAPRGSATSNWGLLPPGDDPQNHLLLPVARHLAGDQLRFWTYPFHPRKDDARYLLPFLGFTAAVAASDHWISQQIPASPTEQKRSLDFSNYAVYSLVGGMGGAYLLGHLTRNDHLSETGLLAAEAAINSTAVTYALKGITQRPRPFTGDSTGTFFQGGDSFPSEHAAIAWSVAGVLAHEYPGTFTKLLAYGLASGISVSRVTSKQHFAADVLVGSGLGWYLGRQVYRAHHDPELGGAGWGSDAPRPASLESHATGSHGSPSAPLDSWVYPAFERLAAWGYVHTELLGMRPWTRSECARLLEEANNAGSLGEADGEAAAVNRALTAEFLPEETHDGGDNLGLHLESMYTRITQIAGPPVTDSYNFGQTIVNDDGRPFEQGSNAYSGISGSATAGPFAFYLRAEYQHAPSAPPEPAAAREAAAGELEIPAEPGTPLAEINRVRILEGYVTFAFKGTQFSFGKQALTWGPTETGSLMWSTNAEPIPMLRMSNLAPFQLPGFLHWLGPMRGEFFIGQLGGQQYIDTANGVVGPFPFKPQPFIHGEKLSFKLTPNMELGFSRTEIFGGFGHPFTFASFWRSFAAFGTGNSNDTVATDAGDSRAGFDFRYRVPHLRKFLTLYTDSFCDDDPSPLGNTPNRCAWSPGFYIPQFPRLPKLDFRAEGVNTDVSGFAGTGINYTNFVYLSGYTNDGNIIGNWVGREGRGVQLWGTYWLGPQSKIQLGYRQQSVDPDFLKGGWLNDLSLRTDFNLRPDLAFSGTAQFEKWNFPLLAAGTQSNLALSLSLTYRPKWGLRLR